MVSSYTFSTTTPTRPRSQSQPQTRTETQAQIQPDSPTATPVQQEPVEFEDTSPTETPVHTTPEPRRLLPVIVQTPPTGPIELEAPMTPETPTFLTRAPSIHVSLRSVVAPTSIDTSNATAEIIAPQRSPIEVIAPFMLPTRVLTSDHKNSTDNTSGDDSEGECHNNASNSGTSAEAEVEEDAVTAAPEQEAQPEPESEAPVQTQSTSPVSPEISPVSTLNSSSDSETSPDPILTLSPQQRLNASRFRLLAGLANRVQNTQGRIPHNTWLRTYHKFAALNQRTRATGYLHENAASICSEGGQIDNSGESAWRYALATGDPEARILQRNTVGRRGSTDYSEAKQVVMSNWVRHVEMQVREQQDSELASMWAVDEEAADEQQTEEQLPHADVTVSEDNNQEAGQTQSLEESQPDENRAEGELDQENEAVFELDSTAWPTEPAELPCSNSSDDESSEGLEENNQTAPIEIPFRRSQRLSTISTSSTEERSERPREREAVSDYWRRKAKYRSLKLQRQLESEEEARQRRRNNRVSHDYHQMLT